MANRAHRGFAAVVAVVILGALAYCASLYSLIRKQAGVDEAQKADCIIVLGAAQYNGRPSPVLRARLDHALELYKRGFASRIIATGGYGRDRRFSEAGAGREYLIHKGIPAEAVEADAHGETTSQSAESVSLRMKREGLQSAILVSDGFHLFRCKLIFGRLGDRVYASPVPDSPIENSATERFLYTLREVVDYIAMKLGVPV
ncbi:MAG: YdcF family protein [Acidobacteriia bacterium]|nr:YdcF family protein [Terriglobia bacterium]